MEIPQNYPSKGTTSHTLLLIWTRALTFWGFGTFSRRTYLIVLSNNADLHRGVQVLTHDTLSLLRSVSLKAAWLTLLTLLSTICSLRISFKAQCSPPGFNIESCLAWFFSLMLCTGHTCILELDSNSPLSFVWVNFLFYELVHSITMEYP